MRKTVVPKKVLEAALAQFGSALVNKSWITWWGLDDEERGKSLLDLAQTYPKLIKRPLIVKGTNMTLGPKPDVAAVYAVDRKSVV